MRSISTYADVVAAREASELSPGDEELLRNCKAGNPTILNGGKRPLAQSPATTIHAQVLRYVIMGGCDPCRTHERGVELHGAYIVGVLDLQFITARGRTTLLECHFDDFIHAMNARFEVLDLSGSQITGMNAQSAKVQGSVFLRNGFKASDEVSVAGAKIGGQLSCSAARLSNPAGDALMAEGAQIMGGILLRDGFQSLGEVALAGAEIGGSLVCSGANLENPAGHTMNVQRAKIAGSVHLDDGFQSVGEVKLLGATIEGQLNLNSAKLSNSGKSALMVEDMSCGVFFWRDIKSVDGHVSFIGAHCTDLVDDVESWGNTSSYALNGFTYGRISGFTEVKARLEWVREGTFDYGSFSPHPYEQLAQIYGEMGHSADRREVLIVKEAEYRKFERQILRSTRRLRRAYATVSRDMSQESFTQIENIVEQQPEFDPEKFKRLDQKFGLLHPENENETQDNPWQVANAQAGFREEIFWQNGKTRARIAVLHLQDWLPRLLVGYGYRPFRVLWFLAFLLITASALAHLAWDAGDFAPNSDVILSTQAWQTLAEDPLVQNPAEEWSDTNGKGRDYETFSPLAYGFDVVVPIVTIGQEAAWAPSTTRGPWGWWLWWARWVLSVLGWIVTAVGAAAITGIIRRD